MSFDPKSLVPWLDGAVAIVDAAAAALPEPARTIAKITGGLLKFASDVAAAGKDPLTTIQRIHAADPDLAAVEDSWAKEIDADFGT